MIKITMLTEKLCCVYLFIMFFTIVFTLSGEECSCRIDSSTKTAKCTQMNIMVVPVCVPRYTKKLLLSGNKIYAIFPRQFQKFTELIYLDLSENIIRFLGNDAFTWLPGLDTLKLNENLLYRLDTSAFVRLFELQTLDLSRNYIAEITENIFYGLLNLKYLYLQDNKIEYLNANVFEGLSSLKLLDLTSNPLIHRQSFPLDVFQPVNKLEVLFIRLHGVSMYYHFVDLDLQLQWLTSLKILSICLFQNQNPGIGFTFLRNLMELSMVQCNLTAISSETFKSLKISPLRQLDLSYNKLSVVYPSTFSSMKNLVKLNLSGNNKLCASGLYNITVGLNFTNIRDLGLSHICQKEWELHSSTIEALQGTHLEFLDLSLSNIRVIYKHVYEKLPQSLKTLKLKGNIFLSLDLSNLYLLNNLLYLDISYIPWKRDILNPFIDGEHNSIMEQKGLPYLYPNIPAAKNQKSDMVFELRHKNVSDSEFSSISQFDVSERKKQGLILSGQKQYDAKEDKCFPLPNNLTMIDVSNGFILGSILNVLCDENYSLKTLNASMNRDLRSVELLLKKLQNFRSLEILNLNDNLIKEIPIDIFTEETRLKHLNLRSNSLTELKFDIRTLIHLEILDLSKNNIAYISKQFSQQIETIAKHSNMTVFLDGNRLLCKCEQLDFVNWLLHTRVVFRKDNLTCEYKNASKIALNRISDIHTQMEAECFALHVLISSSIGFIALIVALSLVALICQKQWKFQYLSVIGRRKISPYHPIEDKEIFLKYDIYISYDRDYVVNSSETLHELVTQNIYPSLKQGGLKVIIREELDIGRKLFDLISHAVRRSRKVVVLLSNGYCRDQWNIFEFDMAVMEGIYTKRDIVVPVMLETLNPKDLHEEIFAFLRSGPVAKFTFDRNVRELINFLLESAR